MRKNVTVQHWFEYPTAQKKFTNFCAELIFMIAWYSLIVFLGRFLPFDKLKLDLSTFVKFFVGWQLYNVFRSLYKNYKAQQAK